MWTTLCYERFILSVLAILVVTVQTAMTDSTAFNVRVGEGLLEHIVRYKQIHRI